MLFNYLSLCVVLVLTTDDNESSILNYLLGFILIHFLYKKKKFDGQVLLMYVTWYGFGRMFIEGLRTDSLYVGVFRISQVLGFLCFIVGALLLILNLAKAHRAELTAKDYEPAYSKITGISNTIVPTADPQAEEGEEIESVDDENINPQTNEAENNDNFISEGNEN